MSGTRPALEFNEKPKTKSETSGRPKNQKQSLTLAGDTSGKLAGNGWAHEIAPRDRCLSDALDRSRPIGQHRSQANPDGIGMHLAAAFGTNCPRHSSVATPLRRKCRL